MPKVKVIDFKKIGSTNDYLKENHQKLDSFTFIKTKYQLEGRGQFDRKWVSFKGRNLLFSFIIKNLLYSQINLIKDWVKNSIIELLENLGLKPYFKEPNDIYVNNKKICGILIETKSDEKMFKYVIIGIGLNVNQIIFPSLNATSILKETKKSNKIKKIFNDLLNILLENYF
ncbi:MAG: biotin--[acetyl-CoA-carboxylase] ligase [Acholeplasmataceae bacterium]